MKKILMIATLLMSTTVFAKGGGSGTYLGLNLNYDDSTTSTVTAGVAGTDSKSSVTDMDALLGYAMGSGLYLGLAYNSYSGKDATTTTTASAMGLSVGYMMNGWMFMAHYYLSGSLTSGTTSYSNGSGIGVDLGYMFPLGSTFNLGLALNYRSIEYKKLESSGVEVANSSLKTTTMAPKIVLGFMF